MTVYVNDVVYHPVKDAESDDYAYADKVTVPIVMPAADADIVFAFNPNTMEKSKESGGYSVSIDVPDSGVKVYGVDTALTYSVLELTLKREDSYFVTVSYSYDGEEYYPWTIEEFNDKGVASTETLYFVGDNGNVDIKVEAKKVSPKTISYENEDQVTVDGDLVTSALPGDKVSFSYTINDPDAYSKGAIVEDVEPTINDGSYIEFTMPDNEVTITFDVHKGIPIEIAVNENILNLDEVVLYQDEYGDTEATLGIPGEYVYLFTDSLLVADGYGISGVRANEEFIAVSDYYVAIPVPEEGKLVIEIVTSELYSITSAETEDATIYVNPEALPGSTVYGSVILTNKLTYVESFVVTGSDGKVYTSEEIDLNLNTKNYSFSFTMPEDDITLSVDVAPYETVALTIDFGGHEEDFAADDLYRSRISCKELTSLSYEFPTQEGETLNLLFKKGDQIYFTLYLTTSDYLVDLVFTNAAGEKTTIAPSSVDSFGQVFLEMFSSANAYTIDSDTTLSFVFRDNPNADAE